MSYVTYENRRNPHVTIHREDCNQNAKRGGEHKYGQGNYSSHTTYSQANAYAVSTGLPLVVGSYCNPDSFAGPSSA
jgi:hypothetical protein